MSFHCHFGLMLLFSRFLSFPFVVERLASIINHFACWLVTQIKVDTLNKCTDYENVSSLATALKIRSTMIIYMVDRDWGFPIHIFIVGFLVFFSRWFRCSHCCLPTTRHGISNEYRRKIGVPRHGKWFTFYDGFLLMFFSRLFPWCVSWLFQEQFVFLIMWNYKGN